MTRLMGRRSQVGGIWRWMRSKSTHHSSKCINGRLALIGVASDLAFADGYISEMKHIQERHPTISL